MFACPDTHLLLRAPKSPLVVTRNSSRSRIVYKAILIAGGGMALLTQDVVVSVSGQSLEYI